MNVTENLKLKKAGVQTVMMKLMMMCKRVDEELEQNDDMKCIVGNEVQEE